MPRLRFPEFLDEPDWEKTAIRETVDYERPEEYIVSEERYLQYGTPVLTANKGFILGYTNEKKGVYYNLPVIIFDDFTLDMKFVDFPFKVKSSAIKMLKSKNGNNLKFIFELMNQIKYEAKEHKRYYISEYQNILSRIPKLPEQQKIAACLSSIDELIAAHSKKLDTLKAYKKGLMQGLFPVEGDKVPRLRFPEFRNEGEWEEEKASNLFSNRIENGIEGLPIYSVTTNDGMIRRSEIVRNFYDIEEPEGNKRACKYDIAYNMMRMWQGALGVAAEDCLVSPAYVILKPKEDVCSEFYFYLLKTERYLLQLISHSQGLTLDRLRLYYKDFAEIPLPHPPLPEQRKIAATLSSLEKLIAFEAQQLEVLKEHKRGLMQGLFPVGETDR